MKTLFISLGLLTGMSSFASDQEILIDASCKTLCQVSVTRVDNSQGHSYERKFADIYTDHLGLTREQLDKKTQKSELDKLCKTTFTEKASSESHDCLKFKH